MTHISPLNIHTQKEAAELADMVFPETKVPPSMGLAASLDSAILKNLNQNHGGTFNWLKYWVATDQETNKIVGVIGLYEEKADADEACWLGWFCVDPAWRGKGVGKQLLDFATNEARQMEKKYLRLYTSTDPEEANAQFLYEKKSFYVMNEKQKKRSGGVEIFYRQLVLNE